MSVDLAGCPDTIVVQAQVSNRGSLGVMSGIPISFYLGSVAAGTPLGVVPRRPPYWPDVWNANG